jgi:flagellar assembly factor FliW
MTMTTQTAPSEAPIAVASQALGPVEIDPAQVIRLVEPLAGFAESLSYALVPHVRDGGESSAIQWLQALGSPFHAFIVADPWNAFPDYAPEVSNADATALGLSSSEDARLYVILTVSGGGITANLRAPLVVNTADRVAKQVVLLGDAYHTRHEVHRST